MVLPAASLKPLSVAVYPVPGSSVAVEMRVATWVVAL